MLSDEEKEEAWSETEIRFRADLLILNSKFPTHRKTEAMEELLEIYNKQSKEIEELKNADLTIVYLNGVYDGVKKVEDKIKAKIEEYEEIIESSIIKDNYKREVEHIIRVLEELKGE